MQSVALLLNRFFDVLWWPLSGTPRYLDIMIISAISALIFLVIFKKTSNQKMITRYKNRMIAHILEIRLYKDQPVLTLKSIIRIIWYNIVYLRYALPSLIVILPVLLIISIQINNRYGYMPMKVGNPFIIRVDMARRHTLDIPNISQKIYCTTSKGIEIETVPLVVASQPSIFWRARLTSLEADRPIVKITIDETNGTIEKKIYTGNLKRRFAPQMTKWHLRHLLLNNAENFIPQESSFESVRVNYKRAGYSFLVWETDSIVLYFILTLIFGFVFKPIFRVNI